MINQNLRNRVKEIFENKVLAPKTIRITLAKYKDIKAELEKILNENPKLFKSIGEIACLIVKDLELAKCAVCGKEVSYGTTMNNKERKFCSNKCKLSKEGNPFAQKNVIEKIKQTHIKRMGVDNPAKSKEVQEKMMQTCMKKYGVKNVFQVEEKKKKIKNTMIKHHGSASIYGNLELREKALYSKKVNVYNKIIEKYKNQYEPCFTIDEYQGVRHTYKWKCLKCGNIFEAQYNNAQITSRCFNCYPRKVITRSTYEDEIIEFLENYNLKLDLNNRKLIWPRELDIVIEDKKVAIEFNGTYWHSTKIHEDKKYHVNKVNDCENKGYKLITIWEFDWINENRKEIIKNKLKEVLGLERENNSNDYFIKEILVKEKNDFLEKYHLQGKDTSSIKLGLYENNILTAVMTINKCKFDKTYEYEINRFAYINNFNTNFSRLLYYFENEYKPKSIILYADRCFWNNELFESLNFKFLKNSNPNFVWIIDDKKYPKFKTKQILEENINKLNVDLNDYENMINLGYNQVYDCGNSLFVKEFEI